MKMKIQKTVKVNTHGNANNARYLWVALHGYGQLTDYFIEKFHVLDESEHFVVAPEGFHRFYLKGTSGRVGASWMTKEERLDDIADNIAYLNQVYDEFVSKKEFDKIIVLGFSQGASTAARWIQMGKCKPDAFVQWAGVFPPDLEIKSEGNRFAEIQHLFVIGNQDPYFTNISDDDVFSQAKEMGISPEIIRFEGDHNIYVEGLNKVLEIIKE